MLTLTIRKAKTEDIDKILEIYNFARNFMMLHNNPSQWSNNYPNLDTINSDLDDDNLYVIEHNNTLCATFVLCIGSEPTYEVISNGNWLDNSIYGTIHRVASNGTIKGVFSAIVKFSLNIIPHLRIDTHPNNIVMQNAILKEGFIKCGNIFVRDGSLRYAYEKINLKS